MSTSPDSDLGRLQRRFLTAVLQPDVAGSDGFGPRIAVYRRNSQENFAAALEAGFPALLGLMGREEFRQMAWAFQQRHPSASGNLAQVGRQLPEFLHAAFSGTDRLAWSDLARVEWAVQCVSAAADDDRVIDLHALKAVPPAEQGELRFVLHPAVMLLATSQPVFALWQSQRSTPNGPAVTGGGPEQLLVRREGRGVELQRLSAAEFAWLSALAAGASFAVALDAALTADVRFDLSAVLARRVVREGIFVGFQRQPAVKGLNAAS